MDDSNKMLDDMRDRLFAKLEAEGISQKAFSENLGVSPQTITDWKKGKSRSFTQKLPLISAILHCDLGWLIDGSGDPQPQKDDETFARILDMAHESRFVKYDGTHVASTFVSPEKKPAPTPESEDGLVNAIIIGRDGKAVKRTYTQEQMEALRKVLDVMPYLDDEEL